MLCKMFMSWANRNQGVTHQAEVLLRGGISKLFSLCILLMQLNCSLTSFKNKAAFR